ncbi:MAG TPA: HigA family addiction module antitoxin [Propylenella sp.]
MEMKNPTHPGVFLAAELIAPLGLTVTQAARALGVGRPALSALLNGRAAVSAEMAVRFEKAFGVDAALLLQMQAQYALAEARRRARRIKVPRYAAA